MNILNALSAINAGQARISARINERQPIKEQERLNEWLLKFTATWYEPMKPLIMRQVSKQIMAMPVGVQEILREQHPEGMKNIERLAFEEERS